jgi:hypothetical protein
MTQTVLQIIDGPAKVYVQESLTDGKVVRIFTPDAIAIVFTKLEPRDPDAIEWDFTAITAAPKHRNLQGRYNAQSKTGQASYV